MKIRAYTVIIIFCVLFAAVMTSCRDSGASVDTDTDIGTESTADTAAVTEPVTVTEPAETIAPETVPDESLREPVENEKALQFIEYQYAKALEVIDLAENGSLSADQSGEIIAEDGSRYLPITDNEERPELGGKPISSFADLSKYIKSIFARSIADDLIECAREHYADVDGVLCLKLQYIDTEPSIEDDETEAETEKLPAPEGEEETALVVSGTEMFLSKFTDTLFRYTAKVTYEATDHVDYFDFIFENTGSGWYWTAFPVLPQ